MGAAGVLKRRAVVDDTVLRRRVAEEAQFTGGGCGGALREAHRLLREGLRVAAHVGGPVLDERRLPGYMRAVPKPGRTWVVYHFEVAGLIYRASVLN